MKSCYNCKYYKKDNLCEYEYQVHGGMAVHIPKDKGKLCNDFKEGDKK